VRDSASPLTITSWNKIQRKNTSWTFVCDTNKQTLRDNYQRRDSWTHTGKPVGESLDKLVHAVLCCWNRSCYRSNVERRVW
jgi:hypothetical protein